MSDTMRDDFDAMRAHRKQKHAEWKERNTAILAESSHDFTTANSGESLLFREPGKPRVDFYPSTGRWRVAGQTKTYRGGAEAFLNWYAKQVETGRAGRERKR